MEKPQISTSAAFSVTMNFKGFQVLFGVYHRQQKEQKLIYLRKKFQSVQVFADFQHDKKEVCPKM